MKLPPPLSWFYEAWMEFSRVLGIGSSKIVLTALWIVAFGLYAVIMKIGKLFVKPTVTPSSLWIDVPERDSQHLHRQF